jgi:ATPase subunit of ABC transporter with duplicated ATPase domains
MTDELDALEQKVRDAVLRMNRPGYDGAEAWDQMVAALSEMKRRAREADENIKHVQKSLRHEMREREAAEADRDRLREAIASALTGLGTAAPMGYVYAFAVLDDALSASQAG